MLLFVNQRFKHLWLASLKYVNCFNKFRSNLNQKLYCVIVWTVSAKTVPIIVVNWATGQHKTFTYTPTNIHIQTSEHHKSHKITSESRITKTHFIVSTPSNEHRPYFERRALHIFLFRYANVLSTLFSDLLILAATRWWLWWIRWKTRWLILTAQQSPSSPALIALLNAA